MPPPLHAAPPRPTHRWWVLAVLCLSVLLVTVDNTIVNVALPTLSRALSATTTDLQWIVDGYTLAFAALLLLGGHLGDRFGRLRMLQIGLVIFAVTSVLASLAGSTGELIAARAVMGVGAALIYPATLALILTTFSDVRERATAIGVWSAVSGLSVAIGPVSGGALLEHFSWGSVFLVNLPLAAAALIANRILLRESRERIPARFDGIGVVGSMAAIGLLVWTTIEAPHNGWLSRTTLLGYTAAAIALAAFVAWEARREHPLLDVRLFTNLRFSAGSGAIALAFFGLFGFIFLITQYFQAVRGYDSWTAGLATLPFALVIAATSPLSIATMRLVGTKVVVAAGLVVMAVGFVTAAGLESDSAYWGRVIISMVLMAGGLGLVMSPATEAVTGAVRADQAGAGSAVNDTMREVGGTLGVAVIGSVMTTVYGPAIRDGLGGLPDAARSAASSSVEAGMHVAGQLPEEVRADSVEVVRSAFVDGLAAGSWVCAAACVLGALAAFALLPARHRDPVAPVPDVVGTSAR